MAATPLSKLTASQLADADARLASTKILVGLDGFVDTILHAVKTRQSATKYARYESMAEWGGKIGEAAGLSMNFEFVTQMVKLGGNGPIMANALASYGTAVTYIGNLGAPEVHPVFADFAKRATVHSVADAAYTDALEFDDGKLMFGKHQALKNLDWACITKHVPEPKLEKICAASTLVALVNWTMLPHMTAIWQKLQSRIAPKLKGPKRWLFVDLADPAKRSSEDIAKALSCITKFQKHFRVILGLNFNESRQVGEVLGIKAPDETYATVRHHSAQIREKLKLDTVVIHPTHFAAAADESGSTHVEGPFTPKPKITTGAGDHFNAGFCIGRLLGLDLSGSLQLGVATSGYYVRTAKSPGLAEIRKFLRTL